jgi:hypothetical protein
MKGVSTHFSEQKKRNRDSVVGTANCYRMDDRGVGVRVPLVSGIFSTSGVHPTFYPIGTKGSFLAAREIGA